MKTNSALKPCPFCRKPPRHVKSVTDPITKVETAVNDVMCDNYGECPIESICIPFDVWQRTAPASSQTDGDVMSAVESYELANEMYHAALVHFEDVQAGRPSFGLTKRFEEMILQTQLTKPQDGMALVPIEPTEAMFSIGVQAMDVMFATGAKLDTRWFPVGAIWQAMLTAARKEA